MSRRSAHLSCNFPSFLGICSLLLIIAVPVTSALVYCQLEPSDAGHGDGYPLPIPLPQESSTRSPAPVTEKPRRTRPRYYECPARTRCCPKNQCCPEPGQEAEEAKPERKFYEIDQRLATRITIVVSCASLSVSALLLVCCFWSGCPLYNSKCTYREYVRDEAGCADKMGEVPVYLGGMPCEDSPLGNTLIISHAIEDKHSVCAQGRSREVVV